MFVKQLIFGNTLSGLDHLWAHHTACGQEYY